MHNLVYKVVSHMPLGEKVHTSSSLVTLVLVNYNREKSSLSVCKLHSLVEQNSTPTQCSYRLVIFEMVSNKKYMAESAKFEGGGGLELKGGKPQVLYETLVHVATTVGELTTLCSGGHICSCT